MKKKKKLEHLIQLVEMLSKIELEKWSNSKR